MSVIVAGRGVILRDCVPPDADRFVHWLTHGEWRFWDVPWCGVRTVTTEEQAKKDRAWFVETCAKAMTKPRKRATIATPEDVALGWVSRYPAKEQAHYPGHTNVGIDICEDAYLNRGLGTEALRLWVGYLFSHSDLHRVGLDTWSFNGRMMRVAEKVGFVREGAERELVEWRGEWLDLVHFGMLREEWSAMCRDGLAEI